MCRCSAINWSGGQDADALSHWLYLLQRDPEFPLGQDLVEPTLSAIIASFRGYVSIVCLIEWTPLVISFCLRIRLRSGLWLDCSNIFLVWTTPVWICQYTQGQCPVGRLTSDQVSSLWSLNPDQFPLMKGISITWRYHHHVECLGYGSLQLLQSLRWPLGCFSD